jgi:antitoxin VapB
MSWSARTATPLRDRIKRLQEATRALGPDNPNFDMKAFMDREWDGL